MEEVYEMQHCAVALLGYWQLTPGVQCYYNIQKLHK